MKKIDKNELYQTLRDFLKSKGISLDDGAYTQRIQQGVNLVADAVNTTQNAVGRAKVKVEKTVDRLRQSVHQATAPRPPRKARASARSGRKPKSQKAKPTSRTKITRRK